jgi:hypothetical protein
VPEEATRNALIGPYRAGGKHTLNASRAILFNREDASRPTEAKARWVIQEIRAHGLGQELPQMSQPHVRALFREDLYEEALTLASAPKGSAAMQRTTLGKSAHAAKTKTLATTRKAKKHPLTHS